MPKPQPSPHPVHRTIDQSRLLTLVGYNLRRAYLRVAREYGAAMEEFGLRPAEFATLVLLLDNAGSSQKSLGKALAMDPPNMATLLDRLENADLVQRMKHPRDERARQLQLTPAGKRLATRAAVIVDRHERNAISLLTVAERTEFMRLLHKLVVAEL